MFASLPETVQVFRTWSWAQIAPYYEELEKRPLTATTIKTWLSDWSVLARLVAETQSRLSVAKTLNTADAAAEAAYYDFLENIHPFSEAAENRLKRKLIASGLEPDGMSVPLHKMRAEIETFHKVNLPLLTEERKLSSEYDKIVGAQSVQWEQTEHTLTQLKPFLETPERAVRAEIWQLSSERQLADREALNQIWIKLLTLRQQLATNAGFENYRAYRWRWLKRFDYTPEDCKVFHHAIETVVVPAANRIYEKIRQQMGVANLRPWDVLADVYPMMLPAIRPFADTTDLEKKASAIFHQVHPDLGGYFDTMRTEGLLDLANRKGKAPGGYCTRFSTVKRPFIFMNAVGTAGDVKTMLHEAGHAFHGFETSHLPYIQQERTGSEFAEVASMAMELLSAPYLTLEQGGYYTPVDAARYRISHLQKIILFWPYMAVVDAFQHWVYENDQAALNPDQCDAKWAELWQRFIPAIDWTGLEMGMKTGWHRKLHIFRYPFYYIEYGLAQIGAIHIWRNALADQDQAVTRYRQALALGNTRPLPALFQAAGARFAFDVPAMQEVIDLLEEQLRDLQQSTAV